jgi:hypothetical protein
MQKKQLGIKFATVQEEQDMMEDFIRQVVDRMIATLNDAASATTARTATATTTTSASSNSNTSSSHNIPPHNKNNNKF